MPMHELMNVLSAAMAPGSTSEQRAAAAGLCRTLLLALEATPGQPLAAASAPTAAELPNQAEPSPHDEPTAEPHEDTSEHEAEGTHKHDEPTEPTAEAPAAPEAAPFGEPERTAPTTTSEPTRRTAPFPAPTVRPPASALPLTPQNVASFVEAARNLPTETLLDLAISHVRNLVAAKGQELPTPSAPVRFHLVPLPKLEGM